MIAHLARARGLLLVLAIVALPAWTLDPPPLLTVPCAPGVVCSALVVPDCTVQPGLSAPPTAPRPLQALPDSIVPATAGGLLPGEGSVSATGEYQYRIPIEVPPGRAGVQPSLALVYGSRGGNGHLGVGWQLEGLSEINRCARTFATEGHADGVSFDANDVFCLDGHKLIAVNGSYGGDGTEYRTEDDTFARIVSHLSPQRRLAWFEVWTRNGRIRTYAPPEPFASYFSPAGGYRDAISWPIQEERDRSGNAIFYSYQRQGAIDAYPLQNANDFVEYYPARIDYTRGSKDGPGPGPRSVRFEYEGRADVSVAYLHGVAFKTTVRLKSILLDAPAPVTSALVWRYDLSYEQGPGSGRSRLTQVRRCGARHDGTNGGCLDAKKFTWNQDPRGPTYTKEALRDSCSSLAMSRTSRKSTAPRRVGTARVSKRTRAARVSKRSTSVWSPSHPLPPSALPLNHIDASRIDGLRSPQVAGASMTYPQTCPAGTQPGLDHPPRGPGLEVIHHALGGKLRPDHSVHVIDPNVGGMQHPAAVPANFLSGAQDDGALLRAELNGRVGEALRAGRLASF